MAPAPKSPIRVLPNRNILGLAIVLLGMAYAGASQSNSAAYLLCFALASVSIISAIHTWANLRGLSLSASPISPTFLGESLSVSLSLTSQRSSTLHSLILQSSPHGFLSPPLQLLPSQSLSLHLHSPTTQRGFFPHLQIHAHSLFPLGFFTAKQSFSLPHPYFIYPSPSGSLPLPSPIPSSSPSTLAPNSPASTGDDFAGLRTWNPGESPRHIDWKSLARSPAQDPPLLAKDWSGFALPVLHLDWHALDPLPTEDRLSQLARWILDAEQSPCTYSLILPAINLPPSSGPTHAQACLQALALYPLSLPPP